MRVLLVIVFVFFCSRIATAEAVRGSLFAATPVAARATPSGLFIGRADGGLFAERSAHEPAFADGIGAGITGSDVHVIRALIEEAESRSQGYDAVQYGARIKTPKPPTQMTLAQIFDWIDATPGQPHAIGRYQFIPSTLGRVVEKTGVQMSQRFTPAVQDLLADVLLAEAGLHRFRAGSLAPQEFMNNLAKIWAGLPNSTGRSHYDGYAGNKAAISWSRFDAVIARIAPS
jgi:muramidase (phage lysozyme)